MRSHEQRIQTLVALAMASARNPELRIGQLIVNALPLNFGNDAFYIEDAALADSLHAFNPRKVG